MTLLFSCQLTQTVMMTGVRRSSTAHSGGLPRETGAALSRWEGLLHVSALQTASVLMFCCVSLLSHYIFAWQEFLLQISRKSWMLEVPVNNVFPMPDIVL